MLASITRERIFFFIITILCVVVIHPFWFPFVLGVTFAYLIEPVVQKFLSQFHLNENRWWKWLASIFAMLFVLTAVLWPLLALITTGVQELLSLLSLLQVKTQGKGGVVFQWAKQLSVFLNKLGIHYSIDDIILRFTNIVEGEVNTIFAGASTAIFATPQFLLKTVIFVLTWCFFLVYGKEYRQRFVAQIIPWKNERDLIGRTMSSLLKALIVANIFVGLIQAALITTTLAIFDLPRYVLFGIIGFFLSFIPMIGTAPLMIGLAAWCFFSEDRFGAAVGVLVCAAIIGLTDNILRPLLLKGGLEINFFWILLAIFGGLASFGMAGIVLGPVVFALFATTLKVLETRV